MADVVLGRQSATSGHGGPPLDHVSAARQERDERIKFGCVSGLEHVNITYHRLGMACRGRRPSGLELAGPIRLRPPRARLAEFSSHV